MVEIFLRESKKLNSTKFLLIVFSISDTTRIDGGRRHIMTHDNEPHKILDNKHQSKSRHSS